MAILDSAQLARLRQAAARDVRPVRWTKTQVNAAYQGIEDAFGSPPVQAVFDAAIDAALAPLVVSAGVKRQLLKHWLRSRADRTPDSAEE